LRLGVWASLLVLFAFPFPFVGFASVLIRALFLDSFVVWRSLSFLRVAAFFWNSLFFGRAPSRGVSNVRVFLNDLPFSPDPEIR